MGDKDDYLRMSVLQRFAFGVRPFLILLHNVAAVVGASRLYGDTGNYMRLCDEILGTAVLAAMARGREDERKLRVQADEFRHLVLKTPPENQE